MSTGDPELARRDDRRHGIADDQRDPAQRDRDRILYSSAFRRLGGVTQVVGPTEGRIFHNRLTHSLKVAQIARRLAEKFLDKYPPDLIARGGGLHPEVAEAAALAHDLGHPPFGHVAEKELDQLAKMEDSSSDGPTARGEEHGMWRLGNPDGFEGNAQSFRILTWLSAHRVDYRGLNLTRATLNAVLKYPWLREPGNPTKEEKFSVYREPDIKDFEFARDGWKDGLQSLEAQVMDHADNITYSVHDLEDFYRAGLIPVQLGMSDDLIASFITEWKRELVGNKDKARLLKVVEGISEDAFANLLYDLFGEEPYEGRYEQRVGLRHTTSLLISQFLHSAELVDKGDQVALHVDETNWALMKFLQRVVWVYVISNPRLSTQQMGQRRVIRELFKTYLSAIERGQDDIVPRTFIRDLAELRALRDKGILDEDRFRRGQIRMTSDIICSFTDAEALAMYKRLLGVAPGSVIDLLHT